MMDSEDKKIDIEGWIPGAVRPPEYLPRTDAGLHPNLKIIARGSALTVLGPRSDSERFRKRLDGLIAYYLKYGYISKESVQQAFSTGVIEHDAPVDKDVIVYGNNGTIVRARTVNQAQAGAVLRPQRPAAGHRPRRFGQDLYGHRPGGAGFERKTRQADHPDASGRRSGREAGFPAGRHEGESSIPICNLCTMRSTI